jgi:hypothetical protein
MHIIIDHLGFECEQKLLMTSPGLMERMQSVRALVRNQKNKIKLDWNLVTRRALF